MHISVLETIDISGFDEGGLITLQGELQGLKTIADEIRGVCSNQGSHDLPVECLRTSLDADAELFAIEQRLASLRSGTAKRVDETRDPSGSSPESLRDSPPIPDPLLHLIDDII